MESNESLKSALGFVQASGAFISDLPILGEALALLDGGFDSLNQGLVDFYKGEGYSAATSAHLANGSMFVAELIVGGGMTGLVSKLARYWSRTVSADLNAMIGANAAERALPAVGDKLPNAGGVIRQFAQEGDQVYYRVFSGEITVGSFLTAVPPRSSAFAREALALPPGNQANFIQEVLVPDGTSLLRSRALPQPARDRLRGGAEQFELLEHIPTNNFGPGRPLP